MPADRPSSPLPPLVGGILVGGGSRRMGRSKALLEWQGATFVERIAATLRAAVPEVVLLGSATGLPVSLGHLPLVADPPGPQGPLAGVLAALDFRPGFAWLILTCDQPLLTAATLDWLIAGRRPGRIAVLPRLGADRIEPFPGIYEPGCRSALMALSAPERRGSLQPLADATGVHVVPIPARLAGELRGANTPEELAELGRLAGPVADRRARD